MSSPADDLRQKAITHASTLSAALKSARTLEDAVAGALRGQEFTEHVVRRNEAFEEFLIELGWPPTGHLPAPIIDAIVELHAQGRLTVAQVEEQFVYRYGRTMLLRLLADWEGRTWLADRVPILREVVENHLDRRYYSSVCTMLPQIEGVIGDFIGSKPNPQNDADKIFSQTRLSRVARDFYIRIAKEGFDWRSSAPLPDLARHPILHGRATAYGTSQHSLKVILVFDTVQSAIGSRRGDGVTRSGLAGTEPDGRG